MFAEPGSKVTMSPFLKFYYQNLSTPLQVLKIPQSKYVYVELLLAPGLIFNT